MVELEKVVFFISFSVEVWKQIITSATEEFIEVFTNPETNFFLVVVLNSASIFNDHESEYLKQRVRNTVDFTDKFCAHLKQRFYFLEAINILLNPKNPNLLNYQLKIRKIVITLLQDKIVKIDCPEKPTIGSSLAELLTLLKAKEFRVKLESQSTEEDISESSPSSSSPENQPLKPNPGAIVDSVKNRSRKLSLLAGIKIAMGSIIILLFFGSFMAFGGTIRETPKNNTFSSTVGSAIASLEPNVTDKTIDEVISIPPSETLKETVADKSTRDNSGSIFQPNPPIPIKNNGILPEKNSSEPEKVKTKLVGRVVYVNSTKSMKDKTLEICDPNFHTTLIEND
ncbi:unnamed protein product [Orchesella dallaii]|uniref:Uncharacterized protein n=1 Tax=Orchesella dallaii TaxID=48710 RepID=A0ABP1R172_9HEXA